MDTAILELPGAAQTIYHVLCEIIQPGETMRLSIDDIAYLCMISPSTVSNNMPRLEAAGLIVQGTPKRGGTDITLMQSNEGQSVADRLAELQRLKAEGSEIDLQRSKSDPQRSEIDLCEEEPRRASQRERSISDPQRSKIDLSACKEDHDLDHHQHHHRAVESQDSNFNKALYERLMKNPYTNEALARRIAANPPGTVEDWETDLERARARGAKNPWWLVIKIWGAGERMNSEERHDTAGRKQSGAGQSRISKAGRRDEKAQPRPQLAPGALEGLARRGSNAAAQPAPTASRPTLERGALDHLPRRGERPLGV